MPAPDYHLLNNLLIVGSLLFAIGAIGCCARRGPALMWLSLAVMTEGTVLFFAAFAEFHREWSGQAAALVLQAVVLASAAQGWRLATRTPAVEATSDEIPDRSAAATAGAVNPHREGPHA